MSVEDSHIDGDVVEAAKRFRCSRPSRFAGWVIAPGVVVPARCGAPNKCAYCAYLVAMENALVVSTDAQRRGAPSVGMTLTTVNPQYDAQAFRKSVEQVVRALRRIGGDQLSYLAMMEWTTGRAATSGGHRRAHVHVLVRGLEADRLGDAEARVRAVWEARTGASRVEVRELRSPAGATAYLVLHHRKREQSPPAGVTVRRFRPSRNYFDRPVGDLRKEAREAMRDKRVRRAAWRALAWDELDGLPEEAIDSELRIAVRQAREAAARVVFVKFGADGAIRTEARAGVA